MVMNTGTERVIRRIEERLEELETRVFDIEGTVEETKRISKVKEVKDGLYFVFRSKSGRFVECVVEYDDEKDALILRGNDSICGRI